jgi:predicted naringenin-chalcone synthase
MFITGIGTAAPARPYTQKECWDFAKGHAGIQHLTPRSQALLRKILLGDNGIDSRHLALDSLEQVFDLNPDALHARFARHAPTLATQAAERALHQACRAAKDIDALLVSTCTGYCCPGLTSYVSERLGLRSDVLLLDLVGQGCGAALPNLRTGEALLRARRAQHVLSVCVEVCSAAFYIDDDPGVLVSACLFGDGAGAAVLSMTENPHVRRVAWQGAWTTLRPELREYLRFEQRQGMLRNILTREVPEIAGVQVERVLTEAGLTPAGIETWVLHAGGRNILVAVRERLGLKEEDCQWSAGILREYGNLSSPCVLFVLEAALQGGARPGRWWMSSFGAGFSCHGALLHVQ